MVDDEDFDKVNQYKWSKDHGYAKTICKGKALRLHRFIMDTVDAQEIIIDHINRDTLDNRKCNLRKCNKKKIVGIGKG